MRLFHISDPKCQHITELMPAIKIIYQMEQEFAPYLTVEFIPNGRDPSQKPGIILIAGNERIRKYYTFKKKEDTVSLRKLLWKYLRKYHNVKDITRKDSICIKDFNKHGNAKVIQGWQNKKSHSGINDKNVNPTTCCKIIPNRVGMNEFEKSMLHEEYRLDNRDIQNKNICKKVRHDRCWKDFAYNTPQYIRCIDENNWICENGYPINNDRYKINNKVNKIDKVLLGERNDIKNDVIRRLEENNGKADRKLVDDIYLGGLFPNKNQFCTNEGVNLSDMNKCKIKINEGFSTVDGNKQQFLIIILFIIALLLFKFIR